MFRILITGLGTSGKTTYRRLLVRTLEEWGFTVYHYDADGFGIQARHPDDLGEKILPFGHVDDQDSLAWYLVEDVRGLSDGGFFPMDRYDSIIYVRPSSLIEHARMILSRGKRWFETGKFDWTRESGWRGTGRPHDWQNLWPITKIVCRRLLASRKGVRQDLAILSRLPVPYLVIRSRWTESGVTFEP